MKRTFISLLILAFLLSSPSVFAANKRKSSTKKAKTPTISVQKGGYSCNAVPRTCSGVSSRAEAQYYLNACGAVRFDRDNDGIACEAIK